MTLIKVTFKNMYYVQSHRTATRGFVQLTT